MPVLASDVHAAGTALPFGFRIPRGAVGAGPVLPCDIDTNIGMLRCRAYLAIDGRPDAVVNAFLEQGYRMGYGGGVWCNRRVDRPNSVDLINCHGELYRSSRDAYFYVAYGSASKMGVATPVALMSIGFATQRPYGGCQSLPPCSRSMAPYRIATPHFGPAPKAGALLDPGLQSNVKVEAGTQILMQFIGEQPQGEYLTLMKVPRNLDATVAAYLKAIADGPWAGPAQDKGERKASGGWRVHSWSFEAFDGGPEITLAVLRNGSKTYVALYVIEYA